MERNEKVDERVDTIDFIQYSMLRFLPQHLCMLFSWLSGLTENYLLPLTVSLSVSHLKRTIDDMIRENIVYAVNVFSPLLMLTFEWLNVSSRQIWWLH